MSQTSCCGLAPGVRWEEFHFDPRSGCLRSGMIAFLLSWLNKFTIFGLQDSTFWIWFTADSWSGFLRFWACPCWEIACLATWGVRRKGKIPKSHLEAIIFKWKYLFLPWVAKLPSYFRIKNPSQNIIFGAVYLDLKEGIDWWTPYRILNFISAGRRHGECPNAYADTQGRYSSADPSVIVSVVPCAREVINSIA